MFAVSAITLELNGPQCTEYIVTTSLISLDELSIIMNASICGKQHHFTQLFYTKIITRDIKQTPMHLPSYDFEKLNCMRSGFKRKSY